MDFANDFENEFENENESEGVESCEEAQHHPAETGERRVRAGELYYVVDELAPEGWSVVEIAGVGEGALAAFAPGQVEAIPLAELDGRLLGPVPAPGFVNRRAA
jgi:hypothetical protein